MGHQIFSIFFLKHLEMQKAFMPASNKQASGGGPGLLLPMVQAPQHLSALSSAAAPLRLLQCKLLPSAQLDITRPKAGAHNKMHSLNNPHRTTQQAPPLLQVVPYKVHSPRSSHLIQFSDIHHLLIGSTIVRNSIISDFHYGMTSPQKTSYHIGSCWLKLLSKRFI